MKMFNSLYKRIVQLRWWIGALLGIIHFFAMFLLLFKFSGGIPSAKFIMCLVGGAQAVISSVGAITFLPLSFAPKQWLETEKEGQIWLERTGIQGKSQIPCFRLFSFIIGLAAAFFYLVFCLLGSIETLIEFVTKAE